MSVLLDKLSSFLYGKKILILGFGREGISTYKLLSKKISPEQICIADRDENLTEKIDFEIHPHCKVNIGVNYLNGLNDFDIVIKTPGIPTEALINLEDRTKITSQTELFLRIFSGRTIGITGTKGKSTTSSLIYHILSSHIRDVLLVGNIGIPPFDLMDKISPETWIVYELSSHQLEHTKISPHIAVILNFFEEHLDHYESYSKYQLAKINITRYQSQNDWIILNSDHQSLIDLYKMQSVNNNMLTFSLSNETSAGAWLDSSGVIRCNMDGKISKFNFTNRQYLPGKHNLMNIMAAINVAKIIGIPDEKIHQSIHAFKGLKHRLEYLGNFKGIDFYNDSISTIPQATIEAVKSLKRVDTLILGGKDRGINYQPLIDFLPESGVNHLIFTGDAGKRILEGLKKSNEATDQKYFLINNYSEISDIVKTHTKKGAICLLSPAAASYDQFRNFEERGELFKKIAETL